jgi:hypothetical protein
MRYAAGFLLLFATACSQDLSSPTPARFPSRPAAHLQRAREMPEIELVDPGNPAGGSSGRRNVFAYPAPAPAVVAPSVATVVSKEVSAREEEARREALRLAEELRKAEEERKRKDFPFPYRYIGRFGPENGQLAAFVSDGQAIVVRTGDVLGGKFLVRAIGIESVEVSLLSAPELRKTLDVGQ